MEAPVDKIYLVDASPYIFRAYFALPEMFGADGSRIEAIHGFAGFLLKFLDEECPSHIAVTFDESLTTSFRNDLFPAYKAQRELPPKELVAQLQSCRAFARAMGVVEFASERFEADDLIGTLAKPLVEAGAHVVVVTSDKDLAQLVRPELELFDYAKGLRYGPAEVVEKFGVRPEQVADYLGLAGDSVDNIPGVRGVGAKTAVQLLTAFEDLDALYGNLEAVADLGFRGARTLGAKLAAEREAAFLSRRLATIALDAPVSATMDELEYRGPKLDELDELCASLGIEGLKSRVHRFAERRKEGSRSSEPE